MRLLKTLLLSALNLRLFAIVYVFWLDQNQLRNRKGVSCFFCNLPSFISVEQDYSTIQLRHIDFIRIGQLFSNFRVFALFCKLVLLLIQIRFCLFSIRKNQENASGGALSFCIHSGTVPAISFRSGDCLHPPGENRYAPQEMESKSVCYSGGAR